MLNADGSFTYIATSDYVGWDEFEYRAFDGIEYSFVATVTIARNRIVLQRGVWNETVEGYQFEERGDGVEERWVGEYVFLKTEAEGPMPPVIASHAWSAEGAYVREHDIGEGQLYGRVRNHTPEQYALDGFFLYWHESSGDGTFAVTDTITLGDGTIVTKPANYSVKSPSVTVAITDNTHIIGSGPAPGGAEYEHGITDVPAVEFEATMVDGPGGKLRWNQLIDWETRANFGEDPTVFADPSAGPGDYILTAQGLDVMFALPNPFKDWPKLSVPQVAGEGSMILHDTQFQTRLMWQSPRVNSLPVSLRRIDWSFEFVAFSVFEEEGPLAGWNWEPTVTVNSSSVSDVVVDTSFPEWQSRVEMDNKKIYHSNGTEEDVRWRPLG